MATKISATNVADSICNGHRITTQLLVYPRFIHSEMCRHRMFSRNTASSRAIPPEKMIEAVKNDPVIPIAWQKQHKGMQGTEYFTPDDSVFDHLSKRWLYARDNALNSVKALNIDGVTKQLINRLLEPWMWTVELVTSTEWENFFHLRCPQYVYADGTIFRSRKDFIKYYQSDFAGNDAPPFPYSNELEWLYCNKGQAEIHMMALAEAMWDARNESTPQELKPGEWHIPFSENLDGDEIINAILDVHNWTEEQVTDMRIKIATARAARTSYTVVGSKPHVHDKLFPDYKKDIELHDRLLASGHFSPFEHCAQAMSESIAAKWVKGPGKEHGWCHNLRGWKSYRSMIPNENRR